jgi:hypothetical protein
MTVPEPLWADPVAIAPSEQRGSGSLQPGHGYVQDERLLAMVSYVDRCWYRCCDLQVKVSNATPHTHRSLPYFIKLGQDGYSGINNSSTSSIGTRTAFGVTIESASPFMSKAQRW